MKNKQLLSKVKETKDNRVYTMDRFDFNSFIRIQ